MHSEHAMEAQRRGARRQLTSCDETMFRSAKDTPALDWPRLQTHLQALGHELDLSRPPQQFAGGLGNLNFLVHIDGGSRVLRRPPFGIIPRGANDMAREHRVLRTLWQAYPWAPRSLIYCEDASIIGAHFLIMEYRPGLVIGGELPAGVDARVAGPLLSEMVVRLLASLHSVDPASVGLQTLGRPEGFAQRTCDGWADRAGPAVGSFDDSLVNEIVGWLRSNVVPDGVPTLLHADFKIDNVTLDEHSLQPRAVLDWDMATRGDPLFDVATLLSYWTEPGDTASMRALGQMPTAQAGFWSRAQVLAAYGKASGRDISDFRFHRVLALFKLGIVFLQLHARYRTGATRDDRYRRFGELGRDILEFTHDVTRGTLD
jgi:aminoglycoside phosphotransferase (APT) family kinase protein